MIFKTSDGQVETNVNDKKQFTINANAVAFEVLSGSIYKNPIKAIVRELATNAYDAHLEAGKSDVPFEVHVPTTLEPFYSIRDFGKGLSVEDIDTVYTELFNSTKGHSNEAVGMLGLGSKTPFSYQDGSFDVVSYQGGKKYVYSAFMDLGLPNITFMGEYEADEPDGLLVKLAVAEGDRIAFEMAIEDSYKYFDVQPKLNKDLNITHPFVSDNKVLGTENWAILRNGNHDYGSKLVIIMGNIGYSVNQSDLKDYDLRQMLSDKQLYIKVNIGDFKIQASRENLSINEQTITDVEALLSQIKTEIHGIVESNFENCDNLWEAKVQVANVLEVLGENLLPKELDFNDVMFVPKTRIPLKKGTADEWKITAYNEKGIIKPRYSDGVVPIVSNIKVLYVDKINGYKNSIQEALKEYKVVVVVTPPKDLRKKEDITYPSTLSEFTRICDNFGFTKEHCGMVTDYVVVTEKLPKISNKPVPVKSFKNVFYISSANAYVRTTSEDLLTAQEVYYIPTVNGFYENSWKINNVLHIIEYMDNSGADVLFVEAPRSMVKKVPDSWKHISEFFENTIVPITDFAEVKEFESVLRQKLTYRIKELSKQNTSRNFNKFLKTFDYADGLYGSKITKGDQLKSVVDNNSVPKVISTQLNFKKVKCPKQATIEMLYKEYPLFSEDIKYNSVDAIIASIDLQDKVRNVKSI